MSLTWLGKLITQNKFNNVLNLKRIDLSLLKSHNSILPPPMEEETQNILCFKCHFKETDRTYE